MTSGPEPEAHASQNPARLWTVGSGGFPIDAMVRALQDEGIRLVVDVRELPLSRKPGYSKAPLARRLEDAGIGYQHERLLGAPPALRHASLPWPQFAAAYRTHLAGNAEALDRLRVAARAQRTVILCAEADPAACHRGLIAEALQAEGWTIVHLTFGHAAPVAQRRIGP